MWYILKCIKKSEISVAFQDIVRSVPFFDSTEIANIDYIFSYCFSNIRLNPTLLIQIYRVIIYLYFDVRKCIFYLNFFVKIVIKLEIDSKLSHISIPRSTQLEAPLNLAKCHVCFMTVFQKLQFLPFKIGHSSHKSKRCKNFDTCKRKISPLT